MIIRKLIKIADKLDSDGLYYLANELDYIIASISKDQEDDFNSILYEYCLSCNKLLYDEIDTMSDPNSEYRSDQPVVCDECFEGKLPEEVVEFMETNNITTDNSKTYEIPTDPSRIEKSIPYIK
jgi:hypothetical protein